MSFEMRENPTLGAEPLTYQSAVCADSAIDLDEKMRFEKQTSKYQTGYANDVPSSWNKRGM